MKCYYNVVIMIIWEEERERERKKSVRKNMDPLQPEYGQSSSDHSGIDDEDCYYYYYHYHIVGLLHSR